MDANWIPIIVAIVAAAPGIFAVWRQTKIDKKKQPLEELSAGVEVSSSAAKALESYSREVFALRNELSTVREQMEADHKKYAAELETIRQERNGDRALISEWRQGISRLIAQLISLNQTPVWQPAEKRNTGPLGLRKD